MHNILHCAGIQARPQKVHAALSEHKGLACWWTKSIKAEAKVGAVLQVRFGDRGANDIKIVHLDPEKNVQWQCIDGSNKWIGTQLTFDLKREGSRTIVATTHPGWKGKTDLMRDGSTKWQLFSYASSHT